MTLDLGRLKDITEDDLVTACLEALHEEDLQARNAQKLPRQRSPLEGQQFGVFFDNAYDAFALRLAQYYAAAPSTAEANPRADVISMSAQDRLFLLAIAVTVGYSMTLSLGRRTNQPSRPDDIAKFCHLLAATADDQREVVAQAMTTCLSISMANITASPAGLHAGVVMREILDDPRGRIARAMAMEAAFRANGDRRSFLTILGALWHISRGLAPPVSIALP